MKIFVKSRGKKQQQDYDWHEISSSAEKVVNEPAIVDQFSYLINSEYFSLILAYSGRKLLLLITALEPKNYRIDNKQRPIRNNIALVGSSSDERNFRRIAISALKGELNQQLEDIIDFDDSKGFRIQTSYNNLLDQLIPRIELENRPSNQESEVNTISSQSKQQLARKLQNYRLPKRDGALVVVTEKGLKSVLKNTEVWQGLGLDEREQLSRRSNKTPINQIIINIASLIEQAMKTKTRAIIIFVILALLGLMSSTFFGWFGHNVLRLMDKNKPLVATSEIVAVFSYAEQNPMTFEVNQIFTAKGVLLNKLKKKRISKIII